MYQRLLLVLMLSVITAVNTMAQDQPVSRRVTVKEVTQGIHVIINEINSENYPKVRIFTTVLKDGKPLKGLGVEDFKVNEDEVAQEPLTVEPKLPPLSVVLMLDTSGSMSKRMKQTQDAAMSFLDTLSGNDSVQVVTFARKVRPVTTMSADRKAAREAISSTLARGDTALYSALYQSVQLLKNRIGRKAVVVLSDGVDDDGTGKPLSKQTLKDVISLAREVNVPIYVLALGTEIDKAGLMAVADETGALYFEAPQASELKALYEEIGAQLAGQYSISYSSSLPADSTERRVTMTTQDVTNTKIYKAPGSPDNEAPMAIRHVKVKAAISTGTGSWLDTGIDLKEGHTLMIKAIGKWRLGPGARLSDANGLRNFPSYQGFLFGTLLGRIGSNSPTFKVGTHFSKVMHTSGRLYLGNNDLNAADNSGTIDVLIRVE
jgi:VWFA-related protein